MNKNCEEFKKEIQELQEIWDKFKQCYNNKVDARKTLELLDEIVKRKDEILDKYERLIMHSSSFETFKYLSERENIGIEKFNLFEANSSGMIIGSFLEEDSEKIFVFDKDENFKVIDKIGGEEIEKIKTLRLKEDNEIVGITKNKLFSLNLENNREEVKELGSAVHDLCVAKDGTIAVMFFDTDEIYIESREKNLKEVIKIYEKNTQNFLDEGDFVFASINYNKKSNSFEGIMVDEYGEKSYAYSIDLDDLVFNVNESIEFPYQTCSLGGGKFLGRYNNLAKSNIEYFYLNDKGGKEKLAMSFNDKPGVNTNIRYLHRNNRFVISYSESTFAEHDVYGDWGPTDFKENKSVIFFARENDKFEKIDKIEDKKIKLIETIKLNGDNTLFGEVEMEDDKTYKFMFDGGKYRIYPLK